MTTQHLIEQGQVETLHQMDGAETVSQVGQGRQATTQASAARKQLAIRMQQPLSAQCVKGMPVVQVLPGLIRWTRSQHRESKTD
jgi:hypothetical protein